MPVRERVAWRPLLILAGAVFALLLATSWRYGYHRDELYFIAIGAHPAFGYVDEPPLVPLLAHALDVIGSHSLVVLRLPSALAGAGIVLLTSLTAREFGAGRGGQLLAAASMAASGILLGASHLISTTTFDLLGWTALLWLVVRALRDDGPTWLFAGLVAGVALEIKTLPIFLLFALLVGLLAVGPRDVLRSRWLWLGALIAVALWLPNLVWEATHDWPQLRLSSSIAAGNSGSSAPRAAFVPEQFLLIAPPLAPIWITGLVRLARSPELRTWRSLPVAYLVLVIVFVATGGKPYYLCGMYPALLGAGGQPAWNWARSAGRRGLLRAVLIVSALVSALVSLPIVPPSVLPDTPIVAMNYDAGEQVGWPRFAATIATAYQRLDATPAVVLTGNYGEAGAVARYRPGIPVYSGHNSMWDLGPPPSRATAAVAVGIEPARLRDWFSDVRRVATIDNGLGLDNDEQGQPVWACTGLRRPWSAVWPQVRHLG